ncbi:MAG: type II CRISPR-associated endonuclease Cas1 [Cohaesibacter sp.]|nr:type II CRISPR-associated endonuclease Cas1 [Cohaesibacter sp.]
MASDNRHLKKDHGFLVVQENKCELGRVPLDSILAVIVHAHGITYSNNLLVALAKQGSLLVLCGSNHAPYAVLCPLENHGLQGARTRAQWAATKPLIKRLWKRIVIEKIHTQADCLKAFALPDIPVRELAKQVKVGDEGNIEARAARRYWPLLMGKDFRRNISADGHNAQLNYGYTILRSMMMRSIVAAGLTPTIGLFHSNRANAFALADDLVEPFRPLVDSIVMQSQQNAQDELTTELKSKFSRLTRLDVQIGDIVCPLSHASNKVAFSLVKSFEEKKDQILYPHFPSPIELASLNEG